MCKQDKEQRNVLHTMGASIYSDMWFCATPLHQNNNTSTPRTGCRGCSGRRASDVGVVCLAELARHEVVQQLSHERLKARQVECLTGFITVTIL